MTPLKQLDYSILQQCMHCGMCLPTCPTYDATKMERSSPRGRIALMRSIADGDLKSGRIFGEEMYFCLGCLACETACPAGVDYTHLFEAARFEVEQSKALNTPSRNFWRSSLLKILFTKPKLLRAVGRFLRFYQQIGLQDFIRKSRVLHLLPTYWSQLEKQTPQMSSQFTSALVPESYRPDKVEYRVGLLSGCVQDLAFAEVNADTAYVLHQNNCEVVTPKLQFCCGSLHAHNGDWHTAKDMARRNIDSFPLSELDAIITNAAGCGSHLKHYDRLLEDDPTYKDKAIEWSKKIKDIHEWLVEINFKRPTGQLSTTNITYHDACHLCHGQKITKEPREILKSISGLTLTELPESTWCCGSAGVYNLTQPEMSQNLLSRKMGHIKSTKATVVTTANPGCLLQLRYGAKQTGQDLKIVHPISLLANAYRAES